MQTNEQRYTTLLLHTYLLGIMRAIILILLLLICGGCQLPSYHLVKYAPFSSYVGHDLTIKRKTCLIKEESETPTMYDMTTSMFDTVFARRIQAGTLKPLAILPVGAIVHLQKVWSYEDYESGHKIRAIGEAILPQTGERVTFEYEWGQGDFIGRAPWDDEAVPQGRYVGKNGKSFKP